MVSLGTDDRLVGGRTALDNAVRAADSNFDDTHEHIKIKNVMKNWQSRWTFCSGRTLSGYKNKVKKRMRICENGGRPSVLDEVARFELASLLGDRPTMPEGELRHLIIDKHSERWYSIVPSRKDAYRKPSRTVVRYSGIVRSLNFELHNSTSL